MARSDSERQGASQAMATDGDDRLAFIAAKIGACADAGDEGGVEKWRAVLAGQLTRRTRLASS